MQFAIALMLPYFCMNVWLWIAAAFTDTFHDIKTQRHDRSDINASVSWWTALWAVVNLVWDDSDGGGYTWKMGQPTAILAPAPSVPSQLAQSPGGMRTHGGTKHSIRASDITAVSSAVSACAKNSVAERADCLCRKYLTPEPEPWEK